MAWWGRATEAQENAWMLAQAADSDFGKVLSIVTHIALLAAACWAWGKRYYAAAWLFFVATISSLNYHICAAYDVCGGVEPVAAHEGDRLTAQLLAFAFVTVALYARDIGPRLISDMVSAR
jgi:phosphatidylglycerophosphate synthase